MKKAVSLWLMFLVVLSSFGLAAEEIKEECGLWCQVKEFLWGSGVEEKALVGKAEGVWE